MKLLYKPQVVKQLKKVPHTEQKKIIRKLELLAADPHAGKPLKGELHNLYSLVAWPYRIIYEITTSSIIIYSIKHRQGVYKS